MTHDQLLIIDFEATCSDTGAVPREEMEIIEIGAVLADAATFAVVDDFQSFVRPVRHPTLTQFCTRLTTITQADIESAPGFADMMAALDAWLQPYGAPLFCSWGDYDRKQLQQDCAYHDLPYPFGEDHLNLKRAFGRRQRLAKGPGLGSGLKMAGLTFEGTAHRGIDDARNMTRLLPWILGDARMSR